MKSKRNQAILALVLSLVVIGVLLYYTDLRRPYLLWWLGWGATTFGFWGWDKMQAKRGGWRVPEVLLYGLLLVGGWLGGLAGMLLFRHKIRKPVFWLVLALAAALQIGLVVWWQGRAA